ncbi:MAG: AAA family ATPase, partial [Chitinivibrionales bacterium]|nr:AAA family ATPase [Chitinivibrionales bacterium]
MLISASTSPSSGSCPWDACLARIQEKVGQASFETWFRTTELAVSADGDVSIYVPNQFFADFVEEHFAGLVREVLREESIEPRNLRFVPVERDWSIVEPLSETLSSAREREVPRAVEQKGRFHTNYTFSSFVVGDSNRMAHAASLAVAEAPGKTSFNPLVIYGGTGLGKTHLMQAIGHFAETEETAERVIYLSSEEFTRNYIDYVVHKRDSTSFYKKFSNIDLLLIDDIHFFSGKPGTQKEFYRIFDRLLGENKQIVLTSDRPPDCIPDMMEHIISRFLGGMITDIQPPNLETRMAIVRKKAETDGYSLPDEVAAFIAANITSNVREL